MGSRMTRTQTILTTALWALLVVMMLTIVAARLWSPSASKLPVHFEVPEFELIDQHERTVTAVSLRGHPWIAAFIFTRCAGPCPMMTEKMSELQKAVPDAEVKLVSFSLDPDYDTPEVLRQYAEAFGADRRRWHFLTGDRREILDVAAGMKITAVVGLDSEEDIIHADYFVLVDPQGRTRGYYRGTDDEALGRLAGDVRSLTTRP
jgi:cytochrome oxidase Cu insertion factor (SCO1/SenC/PrrC family)